MAVKNTLYGEVQIYDTPATSDTTLASPVGRLNETGDFVRLTDIPTDADLAEKADLVDGKVPASQLPSYVDDVIEVANFVALPVTGETGKLYVTLDTELIYRWTGTIYAEISPSTLQNLQSVTDNGNTTTNDVNVNSLGIYDELSEVHQVIWDTDGGVQIGDGLTAGQSYFVVQSDNLSFGKSDNLNRVTLNNSLLTDNRNIDFPNASGTLALLSDIPAAGTIDSVPTDGSPNAVSSNGVFDAFTANVSASNAYADAKVADNLTASTTVAPSKTAVNTGLATKEPTITGGTTAQVWRGNKTWASPLTGFSLTGFSATTGTVSSADDIITAFNKIVGNFNAGSLDATLSKTANYTILAADFGRNGTLTVFVDATSGAVQIELPTPANMVNRTVVVVKTDVSANAVTVKGNGATNINAANTYVISLQYENATIKSNGTQYYIVT